MNKRLLSGLLSFSLLLISIASAFPSMFVSAADALSVNASFDKTYINNDWSLIRTPDESSSGQNISAVGYDDSEYTDAVIPGSALYSYYAAGELQGDIAGDIYYGNNMQILENKLDSNGNSYFNCDYWYRTEIIIPANYSGHRITLNFDGINRSGEIYVNGNALGEVKGPFTRGTFDITDYVTPGQAAAIAVRTIWSQSTTTDTPCFIVMDGWDFSQPVPGRGTGIYKDVYLTSSAYVTVNDPFVYADLPLPDTSSADIFVSSELINHSDTAVVGTVIGVINPGNIVFSKTVTIPANSTYEFVADADEFDALHIENPLLWWPNGMGEQSLYTLSLSFSSGAVVSDADETTFGIREFEYGRDETSGDLLIYINGEKVMCRGGNWGLPDVLFSWDDKDFDTAIRMHREMGFNMIRTWHGTSDWDAFYKACDKYGILVYEDFWLHGYYVLDLTLTEENQEMFINNMIDKFKRLRNHACIALWCGENETYPPDYLYKPMEKYYAELDGTRLLIPVSNDDPVSGGIDYAIQKPAWYFGDRSTGFVTEVGAICIPSYSSLQKMLPASALDSISDIIHNSYWQYHDLYESSVGNKHPDWYINAVTDRYGSLNDSDMEGFAYQAQLVNYETYKAIMEAFNDKMFEGSSGVLLWMSQNTWPSTIWQTYDSYFEATGAYYGCMDACEPLHIQWNSLSGAVKAINSTATDYGTLTAAADIYNSDGTLHHSLSKNIEVNKSSLSEAFTIFPRSGKISGTALNISSATASSSNGGDASLAIDGKADTRWIANSDKNGEYITLDLGSVQKISSVQINWEVAYASSYEVLVSSDGRTFSSVYSTDSSQGNITSAGFEAVSARYIRILCKAPGTEWAYSIWEISVFGDTDVYCGDKNLSDLCFIRLKLTDQNGNLLSENYYWHSKHDTDYSDLKKLSTVEIDASAEYTQQNGSTTVTVTLTNSSNEIAFGTWISAVDAGGSSILPAYYSDNYFFLVPGETKSITVNYDNTVTPAIEVKGYNINSNTVFPKKAGSSSSAGEIGKYENLALTGTSFDSNLGVKKDGIILSAPTTNLGYYNNENAKVHLNALNDGDISSSWQLGNYAKNSEGQVMLGIALNSCALIDKAIITWESTSAAFTDSYYVMTSTDGVNWDMPNCSVVRNTEVNGAYIDTVSFDTEVTAAFVKVVITDYIPGSDAYKYSPKVFEIEIWGKEYISENDDTALVDYSAKSILQYVLTQYSNINAADYTKDSYAVLSNAVKAAENTVDYALSVKKIESAIAKLEFNSLHILKETLNAAKAHYLYLYTEATAKALNSAIISAETLVANSSLNDTANNTAINALNSAIKNLKPLENNIASGGKVFDSISDGIRDTAGETGYYGNSSGETHRRALTDGKLGSSWQYSSSNTENMYFGLKYDESMIYSKLLLYFENGSRPHEDGYIVETSYDGINWASAEISISRNTNVNPNCDTITFTGNKPVNTVRGKYIRIRFIGLATMYAPKIHEIYVYGLSAADATVSQDTRYALGAQLRENGNAYDMRFLFAYNAKEFDLVINDLTEMGTLLVKAEDLGNNELTVEFAESNSKVKKVENHYLCNNYLDSYGIYYSATAITGITDASCNYVARGYYIANGKIYYTDRITRRLADGLQ